MSKTKMGKVKISNLVITSIVAYAIWKNIDFAEYIIFPFWISWIIGIIVFNYMWKKGKIKIK
jgi:hypothetical protein